MPSVLPIAGGAKSGVRDHIRWVPSSVSDSISSVDTETSSEDSSSDDAASSVTSEDFPPSPPVHTSYLAAKSSKVVANQADYFSDKSTFLATVFTDNKSSASAIAVASKGADWNLALMDDAAGLRTLYAQGAFEHVNIRENLVELLDMADEELECDQVIVVLNKADKHFAITLHSLMYVGGVVVTSSNSIKSNNILVGIEL